MMEGVVLLNLLHQDNGNYFIIKYSSIMPRILTDRIVTDSRTDTDSCAWQTRTVGHGRHGQLGMADTDCWAWQTRTVGHGRHGLLGLADTDNWAWQTRTVVPGRHGLLGMADTDSWAWQIRESNT